MWFSRKNIPKPQVITSLGVFEFESGNWSTFPASDPPWYYFSKPALDLKSVEKLIEMRTNLNAVTAVALAYVRSSSEWENLNLEGPSSIDFTNILEGAFSLTFDAFDAQGTDLATVTVEFRDGKPDDIWGAD